MAVIVSIDEYCEISELADREALEQMVQAVRDGQVCEICGSLSWALGSVAVGWTGCFMCITGESDDSEDYEVA